MKKCCGKQIKFEDKMRKCEKNDKIKHDMQKYGITISSIIATKTLKVFVDAETTLETNVLF